MEKKKLKVTFEEWDYECGDGCCYEHGIRMYIDGVLVNNNVGSEMGFVDALEYLGYEVDAEYRYEE